MELSQIYNKNKQEKRITGHKTNHRRLQKYFPESVESHKNYHRNKLSSM